MHSSQYTAIARWADDQGCTVTAFHFLPGAMPDADGAYVLLYNEYYSDDEHDFAMVSLHVDTPNRSAKARIRDGHNEPQVDDLNCGDRNWQTEQNAWRDFSATVAREIAEGQR